MLLLDWGLLLQLSSKGHVVIDIRSLINTTPEKY